MADLPELPDDLTLRPLQPGDVPAVAALMAAAEQVDQTGEYPDADDIAEWWTGWSLDFEHDGLAVCDTAGIVVAYATAIAPPTFRGAFRVYLEGRVRPDQRGRGIGRELLSWQIERGRQIHAARHPEAPGVLAVGVAASMTSLERLLERAGFAAERWYHEMERPLTDLPAPAPAPGVEIVPFDFARDDEVRRAHNASFTEHHGSSERDPESWQTLFTGQRNFRSDLSFLALEDDQVVAYALGYVFESDTAATGRRQIHFGQIGTLPRARGRGLAGAVIVAAMRAAVDRECVTAGLTVDSQNSTGAVGLYERLGFRVARTGASWASHLAPVAEGTPG